MTEKSYVTMEQHICAVCGHPYDTGAIIMDRQVRDRFGPRTVTGHKNRGESKVKPYYGVCPEHQKQLDEGYVFIVGCNEGRSTVQTNGHDEQDTILPGDEHRTGEIVAIRLELWDKIFCVPPPSKGISFAPPEAIAMLRNITGTPDE